MYREYLALALHLVFREYRDWMIPEVARIGGLLRLTWTHDECILCLHIGARGVHYRQRALKAASRHGPLVTIAELYDLYHWLKGGQAHIVACPACRGFGSLQAYEQSEPEAIWQLPETIDLATPISPHLVSIPCLDCSGHGVLLEEVSNLQ